VIHHVPVSRLRARLADLLNRVGYGSDVVCVERHGKPVAYLVSPAHYEEHQLLLDALDRREIERAEAAGELAETRPFRAADFDVGFAAEPVARYRTRGEGD